MKGGATKAGEKDSKEDESSRRTCGSRSGRRSLELCWSREESRVEKDG